MTFDEARQVIEGSVKNLTSSLFLSTRIFMPSDVGPDLSDLPRIPFVKARIDHLDGKQMSLGTDPPARYSGNLLLTYFYGMTVGSAAQCQFIDLIISEYKTKTISGIVFKVPKPLTPVEGIGWGNVTVVVPYQFDTLT